MPTILTLPRLVAPRTPTEKKLTEILSAILAVEKIGIYDSLLGMGIHANVATDCIDRIRDVFHVNVPLGVLLDKAANVRELAATIDGGRGDEKT